ncbi:MAG: NACHT domain-containing protein, partial [Fusobacteriaceae bacterium]
RKVNRISLRNIYVTPDIELEKDGKHDLRTFTNASKIIPKYKKVIFSGEEQQGKTSLLKYYFNIFLDKGMCPIFLDGGRVRDSNKDDVLKKELERQYHSANYDDLVSNNKIVILIDNIDSIQLNRKHRDAFLQDICDAFEYCIFTLQLSFSLLIDEIPALDPFQRAELFGLGNKKREELIQKWISLGVEQTISEDELYSRCDELKDTINSVVKKNIVPPKPIYILMLLQMFEANAKLNLELSSHGHCYQQLIYQSFENAKINDREYDKYLNVLTELAWWIFTNDVQPNDHQLEQFFKEYCTIYLEVDSKTVIRKLSDHSILQIKDFRTGFKYSYIYYFFVGKKIAESYIESSDVKERVEYLITNLHREDFANILIFVAHHTKDTWLITRLKSVLTGLFNEHEAASLDKDQLAFMDEFMKQIPDLILEQREVQKERDRQNDDMDKMERSKKDEQYESLDILANINKTFKGMEIAGQIIKNRHASLRRDSITSLAEDGINSGLRFLKYFISISNITKNEIIKIISNHLSENPDLTDSQIEKHAENAYLHLTYGVINGVVRKIATSVGTKEAMEIYNAIEAKTNTPALLLLKQSIELHFLKRVDINGITECVEKLKGNHVCTRILKELIVQHIYMFPVAYKEKQQLSTILNLSIKGQQLIEKKQKAIA